MEANPSLPLSLYAPGFTDSSLGFLAVEFQLGGNTAQVEEHACTHVAVPVVAAGSHFYEVEPDDGFAVALE